MSGKKRRKAKRKTRKGAVEGRAYEAAQASPHRGHVLRASGSQDLQTDTAGDRVRNWGRYLDENHDLAIGVLDELEKNIVGSGIVTIPKPLTATGEVDEGLAELITPVWKRWQRAVDVTGELSWAAAQRAMVRAWMRDGEEFINHVVGRDRNFQFGADDVPYRLELLESEMCPWDLSGNGWRLGIRHNTWREPTAYAIYLDHPEDISTATAAFIGGTRDFKIVPAGSITHLKLARRWPATRGMSIFAGVVDRIWGIKDLEESERIKNRLLSKWCAAVIKSPDVPGHEQTAESGHRYLQVESGTVIDTLAAGESIVGVGPNYPVADLPPHLADQIRRIASGTGTRYSSIAKRYDGSYSAQRQELVETEGHYAMREDHFVQKVVRTVYERFLVAAALDGKLRLPSGRDFDLIANAEYRGPVTPWIDMKREVEADKIAVDEAFISREQVQIKRGMRPDLIGSEPAPMAEPREPAQLALLRNEDEEAA